MKALYLDCFSGISGDMFLGALIDLGAQVNFIRTAIKKLGAKFSLKVEAEEIHGITAKRVKVIPKENSRERKYKDIRSLINNSALPNRAKEIALGAFEKLAIAESKVHGCDFSDVHFHEIGAVDSIVDIVGVALAIVDLNVGRVISSPLPLSRGFIKVQHGTLPLPAPATLEILKGAPIYPDPRTHELVTPTGAALLVALKCEFSAFPRMTVDKIGYGAGKYKDSRYPNLLRAVLGECELTKESVWIVECDIDDQSPEIFPVLIEKMMDAGALDATIIQAIGKKGRPKFVMSAIASDDKRMGVARAIIDHSSTFGVRYYAAGREVLDRKTIKVDVDGVNVQIKVGLDGDTIVKLKPEFEDCKKLAIRKNIPLASAVQLAIVAADKRGILVGKKIGKI